MASEEIEIIVEANVEKAIKEFEKLLPAIKKQVEGMQKEFNKIHIKEIIPNINITPVTKKIKQVKKQIKEAFDLNDISGMTINEKAVNAVPNKQKKELEQQRKRK